MKKLSASALLKALAMNVFTTMVTNSASPALDLPVDLYQETVAAAIDEGGDGSVVFTGTCQACRKDDPFLSAMDAVPGISSAAKLFGKKE